MENLLTTLHQRLGQLAPDLFTRLQEEGQVTPYLRSFLLVPGDPEKGLCEAISPSCYDYVSGVLEEEFPHAWLNFSACGILHYEVVNLSASCAALFEEYGFPNHEDSRMLRYRVTGTIGEYLEGGQEDGL